MAITVPIISQFNDKGIKDAEAGMNELRTPAQRAGGALKKGLLPAVGALTAVGGLLVSAGKAAVEDQESQVQLAGALRNVTGASDAQIAAVEEYIAKTELSAVTADTVLRPAFGKLVTATGDVEKSQELMAVALDVAARTGKPLETVTKKLSDAYNGNTTALGSLDSSLRPMIAEGADFADVLDVLAANTAGASDEFANTAAGSMARFGLQMDNAKESIGMAILPLAEQLIPHLMKLADFLAENTDLLLIIIGAISGLAAVVIVLNGVMAVFNAIAGANPVVLIVLAVVALIAIFIILQKRFDIVGKAMEFLSGIFNKAKDTVLGAWDKVLGFFRRLPGIFSGFGRTLVNVLTAPYRTAFNMIGKLWNNTIGKISFSIPKWVPGVGGKGFSFPQFPSIPALADGGIVNRPTLALIGEAGPEAVVPLGRGGGMGGTMNVTINMPAGSDGEEVVRALQNYQRTHGAIPLPITGAVRR